MVLTNAGRGVNLEDAFARLHLARLCAHVVHSDQSATDVSRDGAPFWQMLCLLATRWVPGLLSPISSPCWLAGWPALVADAPPAGHAVGGWVACASGTAHCLRSPLAVVHAG